MLNALYQYALQHDLAVLPGFKHKRVKCHFMLSMDGRFLGIDPCSTPTMYCPDIGSVANGTTKCNVLVEKACIPLNIVQDEAMDKNISVKHQFFLDALQNGEQAEPLFTIVRTVLENKTLRNEMTEALSTAKYKPTDIIGFSVDGQALEQRTGYLGWWSEFRSQFASAASETLPRCLITGALAPALATVPKVTGLVHVGGHTAGDAFLCYDKSAFQSYGFDKSFNAPVSEEAMTAVNAALTELIAKADVFGGAKLLHWYSGGAEAEADVLDPLMNGYIWSDEEEDAADNHVGAERDALAAAQRLVKSLSIGENPPQTDARYSILPLSGANGRMMVRGWYEGRYADLYRSVQTWFDDLRITMPRASGMTRPPKLKTLFLRLLKPGSNSSKDYDRLDKELPNLLGRSFASIVQGNPLPDEVAQRALLWLRSDLLRGTEEPDKQKKTDTYVYQLLKAWLRRRQKRKEGVIPMTETLQPDRIAVAYQCGRLMAVFAAVQASALGSDLGTGVLERYYATASTSPNLVLGKLSRLSQYHLAKIGDRKLVTRYERMLSDIACHIPSGSIPSNLTLEQQTEFALGYYQQHAAIFTPSNQSKENQSA